MRNSNLARIIRRNGEERRDRPREAGSMRAITGPRSDLDVETARIEAVASAHRLIGIAESRILGGFRRALEASCALIRAGKKLARDHAADHRARDAAQQDAAQ